MNPILLSFPSYKDRVSEFLDRNPMCPAIADCTKSSKCNAIPRRRFSPRLQRIHWRSAKHLAAPCTARAASYYLLLFLRSIRDYVPLHLLLVDCAIRLGTAGSMDERDLLQPNCFVASRFADCNTRYPLAAARKRIRDLNPAGTLF